MLPAALFTEVKPQAAGTHVSAPRGRLSTGSPGAAPATARRPAQRPELNSQTAAQPKNVTEAFGHSVSRTSHEAGAGTLFQARKWLTALQDSPKTIDSDRAEIRGGES